MFVFYLVLIFVMLFLGFPLYLAFGLGAILACIYYGGIPLIAVSSFFFNYIYSFTLLAIPLFIFAGYIMIESGAAEHLVNFINAWRGRIRGGLAVSMVIACTFFGAEHLLFGTDMPYDSQDGERCIRETIRSIEEMDIPDSDRKRIFEDNARKLLRLPV